MADTMITTTKKRLVEVLTENGLTPEQIEKVIEQWYKIAEEEAQKNSNNSK